MPHSSIFSFRILTIPSIYSTVRISKAPIQLIIPANCNLNKQIIDSKLPKEEKHLEKPNDHYLHSTQWFFVYMRHVEQHIKYIHAALCRMFIFQTTNSQRTPTTTTKRKRTHAFVQTIGVFAVGITCTRFEIIAILLSFWTLTYRRLFIYRSFPIKSDVTNFVYGDCGNWNGGPSIFKLIGHIYGRQNCGIFIKLIAENVVCHSLAKKLFFFIIQLKFIDKCWEGNMGLKCVL